METNKLITNHELIKLVIKEAENIKSFASEHEKARLSFATLDPSSKHFCIYGQMTGNCFSERAVYLLNKCTTPYVSDITDIDNEEIERSIKKVFSDRQRDFSPIELYICLNGSDHEQLIDFIKGKKDKLILR